MNITFLGEALGLLFISTLLLRIAGKKSMAKMTNSEVIIILAIGTTMGHAIKEHKFWQIIIILTFFILYLILIQSVQMRFKKIQRYLIGSATVVIRDGGIVEDNLKKLRLTTEQLEMKLRQKGIAYIANIKTATIESDGGLGFELMEHAQPITRKEISDILNEKKDENSQNSGDQEKDNLFNKVPGI
ncbi:uncharacterized membrane protein YcaP (DUF421 family) [Neobacillus bataviensis]|uniref:Uncharacterized membrane protein YcaP (DUF421 family) n=1 Tax=Neobacillus bataviensis TaxID=220685 RepID=A0A561CYS8_9BACI|nr:YetF domain-containing protein [Neobacillus bataviensis]TWD96391.1 uncharacterized membrane protein YcaP (DUF421 family) [Neobacillus bataviensis]